MSIEEVRPLMGVRSELGPGCVCHQVSLCATFSPQSYRAWSITASASSIGPIRIRVILGPAGMLSFPTGPALSPNHCTARGIVHVWLRPYTLQPHAAPCSPMQPYRACLAPSVHIVCAQVPPTHRKPVTNLDCNAAPDPAAYDI